MVTCCSLICEFVPALPVLTPQSLTESHLHYLKRIAQRAVSLSHMHRLVASISLIQFQLTAEFIAFPNRPSLHLLPILQYFTVLYFLLNKSASEKHMEPMHSGDQYLCYLLKRPESGLKEISIPSTKEILLVLRTQGIKQPFKTHLGCIFMAQWYLFMYHK